MMKLDINTCSLRLREYLQLKKSPERSTFVLEMLGSKYEGLQAGAAKVLAAWGGPDEKALLKEFLLKVFQREHGWTIQGVVVKSLAPLITPDDTDWLLEATFSIQLISAHYVLLHLFPRLTPDRTRSFLVEKLSSQSKFDRWAAARAIMAIKYPDQKNS